MVYSNYMQESLSYQEDFSSTLEVDQVPIDLVIAKVNSRCNLACNYCYVYEFADQSWESQPKRMSDEVVEKMAERIGEYAESQKPQQITVGFHGGEPLLAGPGFLAHAADTINAATPRSVMLNYSMETNGVLLTKDVLEVCRDKNIGIGVSLDGDKEANDRHRLYRDGRSSYDQIVENLDMLTRSRYRHLFKGILAVIDLRNDPLKTYESLKQFNPPKIDFLLPHGDWEHRPDGLQTREQRLSAPYASWQRPIIERWLQEDRKPTDSNKRPLELRTYQSILNLLAGQRSAVDSIGGSMASQIVIETDGSYEQTDTFKGVNGASKLGHISIRTHSIQEAAVASREHLRDLGVEGLSDTCKACPRAGSCGGGYGPHRYANETYQNPSVYCRDLGRTIAIIEGAATTEIRDRQTRGVVEPIIIDRVEV